MRIATANLRHGGKVGPDNAWEHLLGRWNADLVFAQETFSPIRYQGTDLSQRTLAHKVAPDRSWGSCLVARQPMTRMRLPLLPGHVVGCVLRGVEIGPLRTDLEAISVHIPSPYQDSCDRLLDALAARRRRMPLILAGDFNVTTAWRHAGEERRNTPWSHRFLRRLRGELGLVNAWQHVNPDQPLPQTLRWSGQQATPYHCDAVYVDERLLPYVRSAAVVADARWNRLTDHNPIVVELG